MENKKSFEKLRTLIIIFVSVSEIGMFVWSLVNLERLISISSVGTFKIEDQCLIPKDIKLSVQGMTPSG